MMTVPLPTLLVSRLKTSHTPRTQTHSASPYREPRRIYTWSHCTRPQTRTMTLQDRATTILWCFLPLLLLGCRAFQSILDNSSSSTPSSMFAATRRRGRRRRPRQGGGQQREGEDLKEQLLKGSNSNSSTPQDSSSSFSSSSSPSSSTFSSPSTPASPDATRPIPLYTSALWWRQSLGALQLAFHFTLFTYLLCVHPPHGLDVPQKEEVGKNGWKEAAMQHGAAATVWLLLVEVEEWRARKGGREKGRLLPWWGMMGYALAAVASALPLLDVLVDGDREMIRRLPLYASTWNLLLLLLLLVPLALHASLSPLPPSLHPPPSESFSPEQFSSLSSYALFTWFQPVILKGWRKQLDMSDLPPLLPNDGSAAVSARFAPLVKAEEALTGGVPVPTPTLPPTLHVLEAKEGMDGHMLSPPPQRWKSEKQAALLPALAPSHAPPHKTKPRRRWRGLTITLLLFRLARGGVVVQALWQAVGSLAVFIAPLALRRIVDFISHYAGEGSEVVPIPVLVATALLFVGPALQGIADGQNFFLGRRLLVRYRAALIDLIFRKALRLDVSAGSGYSVGELTNLCSVDANSTEVISYCHFLWSTVLQIAVCVTLLFHVLGASAFAGLGFMVVSLPITAWASRRIQLYQTRMMKKKDARMSVMSEILQGIRILKMCAWEDEFLRRVTEAREEEVMELRRFVYTRAIIIITWDATPTLVALCTFLFHTLVLGRTLSSSDGFSALSLFDLLRFPLVVLPDMINYCSKALVSFGRIEDFLSRPEVATPPSSLPSSLPLGGAAIESASFRWGGATSEEGGEKGGETTFSSLTLQDITLSIPPGAFVCIYGPTGGGKTSLLLSLLGDIPLISGHVSVNGQIAYVPQKAWIRNATVKDNILFGRLFNEDAYNRTLDACALRRDMDGWPAGDGTEIGERGVNMSGGQQQRVSLARAVYASLVGAADLVLLDDVLSAVDAHVGEHLFRACLAGPTAALAGRTRVLVTHQVSLTLPLADYIVILGKDGKVAVQGKKKEVWKEGGKEGGRELLARYGVVDEKEDKVEVEEDAEGEEEGGVRMCEANGRSSRSTPSSSFSSPPTTKTPVTKKTGEKKEGRREGGVLVEEEEREEGALKWPTYRAYFSAMGGGLLVVLLLLQYIGVELLRFFQNQSLGHWVDRLSSSSSSSAAAAASPSSLQDALPFLFICVGATVLILLRAVLQSWSSLRASVSIHSAMAARVLRAPLYWFERTPVGRVLNRFSSDVETLDKNLMDSLGSFVECCLNALAVVGVIAFRLPILLVGLLPLLLVAGVVARLYLTSSREMKRLESNSRSPIYSHFSETVTGVTTVRAFGAQDRFIDESHAKVDSYGRVNFYLWTANRWLAVRLQLLGATVTGMVGICILASLSSSSSSSLSSLSGAEAGLVLLYAMQFSSALNWLIRNQAELEMNMNATERTDAYCHLEQEAPAIIPSSRPPSPSWPSRGEISLQNLTLAYPSARASPVLHSVTFYIPPGTRVGVVGRTGAGKSSLLSALYRLVEAEEGSKVVIDGVDTRTLGLKDLRGRLAIVPQEPTLFRGTVRSNLDPFDEYRDTAICDAIRRAHFWEALEQKTKEDREKHKKEDGLGKGVLAMPVTENGENLSVGERQLMCLARALLRKRGVLILDEASANVDSATDNMLQQTLLEECRGRTVLCVAHRLVTVVNYDRVMVLDAGRLVEYDTPRALLAKGPGGMFYDMCARTGNLARLIAMANGREGKEEDNQSV